MLFYAVRDCVKVLGLINRQRVFLYSIDHFLQFKNVAIVQKVGLQVEVEIHFDSFDPESIITVHALLYPFPLSWVEFDPTGVEKYFPTLEGQKLFQ